MDPREVSLNPDERRAEMLEESIAQRRQSINRTLDEISEKLRPEYLLDQLVGMYQSSGSAARARLRQQAASQLKSAGAGVKAASSHAAEAMQGAARHVYSNRWPAVAVGLGAAWWLYQVSRPAQWAPRRPWSAHLRAHPGSYVTDEEGTVISSSTGTGIAALPVESPRSWFGNTLKAFREQIGRAANTLWSRPAGIRQKTTEVAGMAQQKISEAGRNIGQAGSSAIGHGKEMMSGTGQQIGAHGRSALTKARESARRSREGAQESFNSAPLLIGAAALAGGFLFGLFLPRTRREDELLGRPSEQFGKRLRHAGQELAKHGEEAIRSASETVESSIREQGEQLKDAARSMKDKSQDIAEKVAQTARGSAEQIAEKTQPEARPEQH